MNSLQSILKEAADSVHASLAETGISDDRRSYRSSLESRIRAKAGSIESLRKIINTAKLQLAAGDNFDADLTLELAIRELA